MSRSGYSDDAWDFDNWSMIRWRGMVASAIRGRRGQTLLRDLAEALDAMPEKRLIAHELRQGGEVCALGALGARRGVELETLDPENYVAVAATFNVAAPLVQEIEYENDEGGSWGGETPEGRWQRMRAWVAAHVRSEATITDADAGNGATP